MAANKSQGNYFTLFLAALTAFCGGLAYFSTGLGKVSLVLGTVGLLASLLGFLKIKPIEGKTAIGSSPLGLKLTGAFVAGLGWVLTLAGLHLTQSTGGRTIFALLGICVTLFGIIFILPAAFNKNAVWKAQAEAAERRPLRSGSKTVTSMEET